MASASLSGSTQTGHRTIYLSEDSQKSRASIQSARCQDPASGLVWSTEYRIGRMRVRLAHSPTRTEVTPRNSLRNNAFPTSRAEGWSVDASKRCPYTATASPAAGGAWTSLPPQSLPSSPHRPKANSVWETGVPWRLLASAITNTTPTATKPNPKGGYTTKGEGRSI